MDIDVSAEIKQAEQQLYKYEKRVLPRAINSSLNKTANNTRAEAHRRLSKITGLAIKEIKPYTRVQKSTWYTLTAYIHGRRRAFNLIRWVLKSKRFPGAFRKQQGVKANPWRSRRRVHKGAFIITPAHGKPIVVKRASKNSNKLVGVYGPSLHVELNKRTMRTALSAYAKRRFVINFDRDLNYYVQRAG